MVAFARFLTRGGYSSRAPKIHRCDRSRLAKSRGARPFCAPFCAARRWPLAARRCSASLSGKRSDFGNLGALFFEAKGGAVAANLKFLANPQCDARSRATLPVAAVIGRKGRRAHRGDDGGRGRAPAGSARRKMLPGPTPHLTGGDKSNSKA